MAKMLFSIGKMPVMFPAMVVNRESGFNEKPPEGPTLQFGKYLANSCVGCHGSEFRGGKIPGGDPSWPEAKNIRLGSNPQWSEASFRETIKTGVSATTKQPLRPPMPIALLAQLNDDEVKALWEYLSSLK
jgi:mono/diheme cytochrome c family protein